MGILASRSDFPQGWSLKSLSRRPRRTSSFQLAAFVWLAGFHWCAHLLATTCHLYLLETRAHSQLGDFCSLTKQNTSHLPVGTQPWRPGLTTGLAGRHLCSLSSSAYREAGLFKAGTFQRGLFLTKGRPTGLELLFLNIQTSCFPEYTDKWSASQVNGAWCALNKTPSTSFPSGFLEFIYWHLQILELQKWWVLPRRSSQSVAKAIPLKRLRAVRW